MTLGNLDIDRNIYTVEGAICYHERKRQLTGGEEGTGFPEMGKLLEQEGKGARKKGGSVPSLLHWDLPAQLLCHEKQCYLQAKTRAWTRPAKECLASEMLHCNSPTPPRTARRRGSP